MEWSIEVCYPWRCILSLTNLDQYFREPQMKPSEADEPGSVDYNQRLWRRTRNDRIIIDTDSKGASEHFKMGP